MRNYSQDCEILSVKTKGERKRENQILLWFNLVVSALRSVHPLLQSILSTTNSTENITQSRLWCIRTTILHIHIRVCQPFQHF